MCKLPKAGPGGCRAEPTSLGGTGYGGAQGGAGQGRGPIQFTDSGGQAPPSPAFSQRALKGNRLCVSQARTQPVNPATKHCRNPAQQAEEWQSEETAVCRDGCLRSSVISASPH